MLGDRARAKASAEHLERQFAAEGAKQGTEELLNAPSRLDAQPAVKNGLKQPSQLVRK
jgi:hypothetical protein